jgi:peptidoglycan/LPS O-acetylase OafA/YrhL
VAILAVIAFHGFPSWLGGGFIGVDVFFVISGFLITSIVADAVEQRRFSFAHFYARRMRRLFPALIVVLAACWAIGWRELLPSELDQLGRHMIGGAGFVANLMLWREALYYFDTLEAAKPLLHLWSLGVEEQFYLFWPLTLVILLRTTRRHVTLVTAVITAVSFAWGLSLVPDDRAAAFYSPASRMWELLAGAMLALRPLPALQRSIASSWASFCGSALIVGSALVLEPSAWFPGWRALLPVGGAVRDRAAEARHCRAVRRLGAPPFQLGEGRLRCPPARRHTRRPQVRRRRPHRRARTGAAVGQGPAPDTGGALAARRHRA